MQVSFSVVHYVQCFCCLFTVLVCDCVVLFPAIGVSCGAKNEKNKAT